ncbi:uncharacterized protein LOC121467532 [Drosophila elegans]|uniref:uncharacterized protein LOC121467532 n=1 Tax=Drosophila elegans TaxID=30023 RepID=UPI001BC84B5D|nr:uncharacterized protein LOC121467532 [Drosophila elegans]
METVINCDICLENFSFKEFEAHYEYCVKNLNAFEAIMNKTDTDPRKRPLKSRDNQQHVREKKRKKSCNPGIWQKKCFECGAFYLVKMEIDHIATERHRYAAAINIKQNEKIVPISIESHFPIKSYRVYPNDSKPDIHQLSNQCNDNILKILYYCLSEYRSIKFQLSAFGVYIDEYDEVIPLKTMKPFVTPYKSIYEIDSVVEEFSDALDYLITASLEFHHHDHNFSKKSFQYFEITAIKLEHIQAAGYIPAPDKIKSRNALINVRNIDNYCFKWSVLAYLGYVKHETITFQTAAKRKYDREKLRNPSHYKVLDISEDIIDYNGISLDFSGIKFPINIEGIKRFEKNNTDFSINVYEVDVDEKNVVGPTIRTKEKRTRHINLLAINNKDKQIMHYAYITSMGKLCFSQHSKSKAAADFCENCLQFYNRKTNKHNCGEEPVRYPLPNTTLCFESHSNSISPPVVIYADIESSLEPKSSEAWAAAFYIVHQYNPNLNEMVIHEGSDCIRNFCKTLKEKLVVLYNQYWKVSKPPNYNLDIYDEFTQDFGQCCVCEEDIDTCSLNKCFNQFTGEYIGPVHSDCKPKYKLTKPFFPVVFHNLTRFDTNLLFSELGKYVKPIPGRQELYTMFSQHYQVNVYDRFQIKFMDSNNFLNYNLEELVSYMEKGDLKNLKMQFPGEQFDVMSQKKMLRKNFLESFDQLNETRLPKNHYFFNYADRVWDIFGCNRIGDYLKSYFERDVILLADVFEHFRRTCLEIYKLDPVNYPTASSMSWDAMLKVTKVNLDLISDPDMYNFLKSAVRGGLVQCNQESAKANNKYMDNFDPKKPIHYLASFEANNLSEWAMSQPLPFSNFTFLKYSEIETLNVKTQTADGDVGYILEVDIEYPNHLYRTHIGMPFCPEYEIIPGGRHRKLTASCTDKKKYIIHLKHLQLCLQNGLVLTKIHRVMTFNQSCWLKPYIDLNIEHKKLAKNKFEWQFFKLMNEVIVGKSLENVEKRRDVALVTHYQSKQNSPGFRQRVANNNFRGVEVFSNNLAAIESTKTNVIYDRPIYIGFSVLEMSKWFMYEHYYNFLSVKCRSAKIIFIRNNLLVASYMRKD